MKYLFSNIVAFILSLSIFYCDAQNTSLNVAEFEAAINNKSNKDSIQILDVRTPGEYDGGHITGALLADWNNKEEFDRRVAFIDKSKPVYVYCLGGGRSSAAAKKMRLEGYEKVYELVGGINAWKSAARPLEGKSDAKQMSVDEFNTSINSSATVLVDFGAVWCPPCRKMEPVLNNLATNNPGKFKLVKVDGSKDQELLELYKVTALPVFILFKNGKQVWRRDGVASEKELAEQL